jgi:hypothetical protein
MTQAAQSYRMGDLNTQLPAVKPPLRRNLSPVWLERRMAEGEGERSNEIGLARAVCEHCGGRALDAKGHPKGKDGLPVCLKGKRGWQW